jgi:uncharacterized protein YndB with AHSA1/START domain
MGEATGTEPVVCERWIAARPETVFAFFTDPEKVTRWLAAEATHDPRPGGVLHQVHYDRDGTRWDIRGEFVEVEPPSRLIFTWDDTRVEVTLVADGDGTRLTLVHHGVPASLRADHEQGWAAHFDALGRAVGER